MSNQISKLRPQDFQTESHYWDTFGHYETEMSARWIVKFLQHRGTNWEPFRVSELNEFYRTTLGRDENFCFNRLAPVTHVVVSSSSRPPIDADCISSSEGFGWRYTCRNRQVVTIDGDLCLVSDKFIEAILSQVRS